MDRRTIIASIRFVLVTLFVTGPSQTAFAAAPSATTGESTTARNSAPSAHHDGRQQRHTVRRRMPVDPSQPEVQPLHPLKPERSGHSAKPQSPEPPVTSAPAASSSSASTSSAEPKRVAKPLPTLTPDEAAVVVADLKKKGLRIPIDSVSPDTFKGMFYLDRGGEMHRAVDILAPRNTPVHATDGGRIVKLWNSVAGGITIYQNDATGRFIYYYAHLECYALDLKEGDPIQKGQIIGYVGTSGNAPKNTPHLHFAIYKAPLVGTWYGGAPVDPWEVYSGNAQYTPLK